MLLLLGVPAPAQMQTRPQQLCINTLNRAAARIASAVVGDFAECVKRAGRDELPAGQSAAQCLTADARGRVAKAKARAAALAAKKCVVEPDFGPTAASLRGVFAKLFSVKAVFGSNLDAALIHARANKAGAACQATVARSMAQMARLELREFNRCKASGLRKGSITSAADLAACAGAEPKGRVARAIHRAQRRARRRCAHTSVATACPGECSSAALGALFDCVRARVACDVCLAINATDGAGKVCHRFQDGVATAYCGDRPVTTQSVARQWDEELLSAIRVDTPRPTVHARNLFHTAVAMYDAWAAYGHTAVPYLSHESPPSTDVEADRATAISFAAYRVLSARFAHSVGAAKSLPNFDDRLQVLGYDKTFTSTDGDAAAAVGNRIGAAVLAYGASDGANDANDYADTTGYAPVNEPLVVKNPGTVMIDPNRWQPLTLDVAISQNGVPLPQTQVSIGSQWENVTPFALTRSDPNDIYLDPGPQPMLGGAGDDQFKQTHLDLIRLSSQLDPDDGVMIDISPGMRGNNTLGADDGHGRPVNPVTGLPYPPNPVLRGDWGRVLAEFWADGPRSETPPGHWNVIANFVSDDPRSQKQIGGTGSVLNALEWDVKIYFAINGAVHDAAIAAWGAKRKYDGVRPISAIRYMGQLGQSTDPMGMSYNVNGLPLEPGLVEVITAATTAPGQPHAGLAGHEGEIAVKAWPGEPDDPRTQVSHPQWILAANWIPYQKKTFVTPAFPGYFSGHSTFSRAAAEVMTRFTGSPYFPGGVGEFIAEKDKDLTFELGPSETVVLQWATYYDAADEAGQSRRWGGIHVSPDDFTGRITGSQVGIAAFDLAERYFTGTIGLRDPGAAGRRSGS